MVEAQAMSDEDLQQYVLTALNKGGQIEDSADVCDQLGVTQ